jgi:hypothetical protein
MDIFILFFINLACGVLSNLIANYIIKKMNR